MCNDSNEVNVPIIKHPFFSFTHLVTIFQVVGHWNPTDPTRPIRSLAWLQSKLNDIRANFTIARQNYHKSGHHEGDFPEQQWHRYCRGQDSNLYCFLVWGDSDAASIADRALPIDRQVDDSILLIETEQNGEHGSSSTCQDLSNSNTDCSATKSRNSKKRKGRTLPSLYSSPSNTATSQTPPSVRKRRAELHELSAREDMEYKQHLSKWLEDDRVTKKRQQRIQELKDLMMLSMDLQDFETNDRAKRELRDLLLKPGESTNSS